MKDDRPKMADIITFAMQRKIDVFAVGKFDHWGHSIRGFVNTVGDLLEMGIVFVSLTEAFDFSTLLEFTE